MTQVFDRRRGTTYTEPQYAAATLRHLYGTRLGRALLPILTRPLLSELAALSRRTRRSARTIPVFCAEFGVDLTEFAVPPGGYRSFAEFFVRPWADGARPAPTNPETLLAPADGKLLLVPLDGRRLVLKGVAYSLDDLLADPDLAGRFAGGTAVVVRLTVDDAHRFCAPAAGRVRADKEVRARLHTVGPAGGRTPFLATNSRCWQLLDTGIFGDLVCVEVGALLVGRILRHRRTEFAAGDERGRFELGGSTVVVLTRPDAVAFDGDLTDWSARGIETRVRAREQIGVKLDRPNPGPGHP